MKEGMQFRIDFAEAFFWEVDLGKAGFNVSQAGGIEPGADEDLGERVGVITYGLAVVQLGFHEGCPPPHEGVIDAVILLAKSLDEEGGELGFITRAVGDFVNTVSSALLGGPEFVFVNGNGRSVFESLASKLS